MTPPPGAPAGTVPVTPEEIDLPVPWYKKPGGIAAIVVGALLVIGLIFALVWAGGGDEDDDVEAARVVLLVQDATGAALDQGFVAEAVGTSDDPNSFNWLEPDTAAGIEGVGGTSGDSGRITFTWAPDAAVAEPETWTSTITIVGQFAGRIHAAGARRRLRARPSRRAERKHLDGRRRRPARSDGGPDRDLHVPESRVPAR